MPEDVAEGRRERALELALQNAVLDTPTDNVLAAAKKYEAYLSGAAEAVEHAPDADPPRPTLEQPRHTAYDANRKCLGCEWSALRQKVLDRAGEAARG